jgi:hypothetical protein
MPFPLNGAPFGDPAQAGFGKSPVFPGQLKCILLVSHQEEFADAFADRYYFELKERSARATRYQG